MDLQDHYIQELGRDGRMVGVRPTDHGMVYADVYPHGAELTADGVASQRPEFTLLVTEDGAAVDVTEEERWREWDRKQQAAEEASLRPRFTCERHGLPLVNYAACELCYPQTADPE